MDNKLTLKLDSDAISVAKKYASKHHTSLSALAENYFQSLKPVKKKRYRAEELAGCLKDLGHLTDSGIKNMYLKDRYGA